MILAKLVFFTTLFFLIEVFLLPFPFVFLTLFLYAQLYSQEVGLLLAFILGLFFDLFFLHTLGTTPFLFVGLLFLTTLYKRKYETNNLFFLGIAIFISVIVLDFYYRGSFNWYAGVFAMIVTMIVGKFFLPLGQKYESWNSIS